MRKILTILLGFLSIVCLGQNDETKNVNGRFIVERLDKAGYFNLTDSENLEYVKKYLAELYDEQCYFGGVMSDASLHSLDNRFYWIDSEELFEVGGLTEYLDQVNEMFKRLGLKLEYTDEKNEFDEKNSDYWKHTIKLNGKEYTAFDGVMDMMSWETAFRYFVEMLNDQLRLQGSNEQVYMVYTGNDSQIVFLTDEMYRIVKEYYLDDENLPLSLTERKKLF